MALSSLLQTEVAGLDLRHFLRVIEETMLALPSPQATEEDILVLLNLRVVEVLSLLRHFHLLIGVAILWLRHFLLVIEEDIPELGEDVLEAVLALSSLLGLEVPILLRRLLRVEEIILALPHLQQIGAAQLSQLTGTQLQGLLGIKASEVVAISFLIGPTPEGEVAEATRSLCTPASLV
ncbi:hypothetical protein VPNG_06494 [Cytospora leucostoma]|uniref:Uncharacterized protein n=1 Tax=Cytospora leucostoma TaxID=1230097 RepID=A0A423X2J1_9PEZI|nr:hypothetical protein VPNG_06494 [Cytospora leucostoma]